MRASVCSAGLASALLGCGVPRPVALPEADCEALVALDAETALAVLVWPNDKEAWIARVDTEGRARWLQRLPDVFAGAVPREAAGGPQITANGQVGVLQFIDPKREPAVEHWLGFSLADGAPGWHHSFAAPPHELDPEAMQLDRGQRLWVGSPGPAFVRELTVADLVTGATRFTRAVPDTFDLELERGHIFAGHVALVDPARGAVIIDRSDGAERATLPLAGRVCALGETLIGFDDDRVVAHDLADLAAPPRVLAEGLADAVPRWTRIELQSCHRRGGDVALQLYNGERYLVTLGPTRRQVTGLGVMRRLALPPELGDFVLDFSDTDEIHALTLLALVDGPATPVRQLERLVHDGDYGDIEVLDAGWLVKGSGHERLDLLSVAVDGTITGAARVLGDLRPKWQHEAAAGRLWLFGGRPKAGALPLRVLDTRTLTAVSGTAGTLVDLTAEARAAWLPPREPEVTARPFSLPLPPQPPDPAAAATPWPRESIVAATRALGHTGTLRVLAWQPWSPEALVVAYERDAAGPRWTFVRLHGDGHGGWSDQFLASDPSDLAKTLLRRPTRTDVERQLHMMSMRTHLELGSDSGKSDEPWIDAEVYRELTGRSPRWRTPAPARRE